MIEGDLIVPLTPDSDRSVPPEDDSGTIPPTPRRALIVALTNAVNDPAVVDDLALARVVAKLLVRILGRARRPTAR